MDPWLSVVVLTSGVAGRSSGDSEVRFGGLILTVNYHSKVNTR